MKKRNSFAILTIAGAAVLSLASCGPEKQQEEKKEHVHTYSELHPQVDPTCLSAGQKAYYTCDGCDKIFNENKEEISQIETIPASAHVPHHHDGVAPTCTEPGTGEYWTCDNECDHNLYGDAQCANVISSIPVVGPKGHAQTLTHHDEVPATCLENGVKEHWECPDCNMFFSDDAAQNLIGDANALADWKTAAGKILAKGHAQTLTHHDEVPATCLENGVEEYWECPDCNMFFSDDAAQNLIGDATALADWKTAAGKILAKGHDAVLTKINEVPATCIDSGVKEHFKCESCGEYFEDSAAEKHIEDLAAWKAGEGLLPATGKHVYDYANKEVAWEGDMAKVVAKCETEDCTEEVSETKQGSYVKDTDATCTSPELGHYEVTFTNTNFGSAETDKNSVPNGDPIDHTFGDLIPQVNPTRTDDGVKAHYQCSECKGLFDEDKHAVSADDLAISKSALTVAMEANKSYDLPDIPVGDLIVVDIKLDAPGKAPEFMLGDGWSNYIGYFKVSLDENGTYSIQDNRSDGVSYNMTEDGYFRMYIDQSKVTFGQNISSMEKYDLLWMRAPEGATAVSGTIVINPGQGVGGEITRGYKLKADGWKYLISGSYSHSLEGFMFVDVKFISDQYNFTMRLEEDWGTTTKYIKVSPQGKLVDRVAGVQVFNVNHKDGFADGYFRVVINLGYLNSIKENDADKDFTKVNRIVVSNNNCEAYVDVDPIFDFEFDPVLNFEGKTDSNVKFEFCSPYAVNLLDEDGCVKATQALSFNVKGEGTGRAKFALMDSHEWENMSGQGEFIFENSVLTEVVFHGDSNTWGQITDNKDGSYNVKVLMKDLQGDGFRKGGTKIDFFYGDGIIANGLTKFSIDLGSFELVDGESRGIFLPASKARKFCFNPVAVNSGKKIQVTFTDMTNTTDDIGFLLLESADAENKGFGKFCFEPDYTVYQWGGHPEYTAGISAVKVGDNSMVVTVDLALLQKGKDELETCDSVSCIWFKGSNMAESVYFKFCIID